MLTDRERETALKIAMAAKTLDQRTDINARLLREHPTLDAADLASLWREASERQAAEALVAFLRWTSKQDAA